VTVFGAYARYYDLLYAEKDYAGEVAYVDGLLREAGAPRTLLDLGCGTALHASLFAARGYEVTGIDQSEVMLARAAQRLRSLPDDVSRRVTLAQGDICSRTIGQTFDAVVSLFHVMSYQTSQSALKAAFANARAHLAAGGIFVFDCWYGPAVLTDRPVTRTRHLEDDSIHATRLAEPVMRPNENVVEVNYRVTIRDKASGNEEEVRETHLMRYLFLPEMKDLLEGAGFEFVRAEEWMTGRQPGFDTWSVCVIARARAFRP
jgi:SAM-dependent methyltransferase